MARDTIKTSTDNDQDESYTSVTGTQIGSKRALDTTVISSAAPSNYDDIVLTYTGSNLTTVVWKLGAVTLKTATLTYTGSQLDRVQWS